MGFRQIRLTLVITACVILMQIGAAHATCSLGGAAASFGNYDSLSLVPLDTIGSLVFQCSQRDHNVLITLSRGFGSSFSSRRMVNGSDQLLYNLYRDSGRTIVWGDGSGGSQAYQNNNPQPNNRDITVPIFGRIPPGQNAKVGNYSDTITVTLTY
jgi:spore coat protein U-like protein